MRFFLLKYLGFGLSCSSSVVILSRAHNDLMTPIQNEKRRRRKRGKNAKICNFYLLCMRCINVQRCDYANEYLVRAEENFIIERMYLSTDWLAITICGENLKM